MSNEREISNWWDILLTLGGVFAVINMIRALKKPPKEAYEQYEEIIIQKDKIIAEYEKKCEIYEKLLKDHGNRQDRME